MTQWTNWSGGVTCTPHSIITPVSEAGLIDLVRQAARTGTIVRVAGSGHSFTPLCATGGLLISLDRLQGLVTADPTANEATAWAGTKLYALGDPLWEHGLAMANMGDIDRQALAGAISTGTHGTGRTLGSLSTQVVALRLVTASGDVLDCSPIHEPEIFKAAQVSLGSLGVITQVTLRLLPAYYLHERTWVAPFDECLAQLDEQVHTNRHFEFFWVPEHDVCAMKTLNPVEPSPGPEASWSRLVDLDLQVGARGDDPRATHPGGASHDSLAGALHAQRAMHLVAPVPEERGPVLPSSQVRENQPQSRLARYVRAEHIDRSYRIFPSERTLKFNETEFAVPAASGPECLCEIRLLMHTRYPEVVWPIEYRTLAADDLWLSPAYGRETVTISVHQAAELSYQPFFADVEAIFRNHHGRPHWGKIHSHTAQELAGLYPKWDRFQSVRQQVDPGGRFLNDHLRVLFGR